jgi:phage terminase large subunit-like protein
MLYSTERAERAIRFFERALVHCDGEWAGKPFLLMDWQADLLRRLYGTLNDDGTRQYRTCYVEIPRKCGKSEMAAGIALYSLLADEEPGAQVYGAAKDRDQASIVFRVASEMIRRSPALSKRARVIESTKRVLVPSTASFYRAIPADAAGSHGFNASAIVVDEVHVQPNRELIDVLTTSTGARRQPLTFYITTAGYDKNSICWELHDYALKVRAGTINDPTFLPVVYSAEEGEDWKDPAVWAKANPSLGTTLKAEYLEQECKRAQEVPAYENTFRRLHLNQWTNQETRWLPLDRWDACQGELDLEALRGRPCYGGLDLSSTTDLSAFSLVFPREEGADVLCWFWMPEDVMRERERRDRVPYSLWARQGLIQPTPGNVVDYDYIEAQITQLADTYEIREIAYDPWNATQLVLWLQDKGLSMVPTRQGFASLSAPTKALEQMVLGRRIRHDNNPVLRWMVDSVTVAQDPAGNIKPVKPDRGKSAARIDGVVAMVMAIDRLTRRQETGDPTVMVLSW